MNPRKDKVNLIELLPKELADKVCRSFNIEINSENCNDQIKEKISPIALKLEEAFDSCDTESENMLMEKAILDCYAPWLWEKSSTISIDWHLRAYIVKMLKCHNNNNELPGLLKKQLCGANLTGSDLNDIDLQDVNLANADLCRVTARNTNLSRSNLTNADLNGVDFSGVDFTLANFTGVNFDERLNKVIVSNFMEFIKENRDIRMLMAILDNHSTNNFPASTFSDIKNALKNKLQNIIENEMDIRGVLNAIIIIKAENKHLNKDDLDLLLTSGKNKLLNLINSSSQFDKDMLIYLIKADENSVIPGGLLPVIDAGGKRLLELIGCNYDIDGITHILLDLSTVDPFLMPMFSEIIDAGISKLLSLIDTSQSKKIVDITDSIIDLSSKPHLVFMFSSVINAGIYTLINLIQVSNEADKIMNVLDKLVINKALIPASEREKIINTGKNRLLHVINTSNDDSAGYTRLISSLSRLIRDEALKLISEEIITAGKKRLLDMLTSCPALASRVSSDKLRGIADSGTPKSQDNSFLGSMANRFWSQQPRGVDEQLKAAVESILNSDNRIGSRYNGY